MRLTLGTVALTAVLVWMGSGRSHLEFPAFHLLANKGVMAPTTAGAAVNVIVADAFCPSVSISQKRSTV